MHRFTLASFALVSLLSMHDAASAQAAPKQSIADISFLVGSWSSEDGVVADTGETSHGTSTVSSEAGGNVLLRRDRTELSSRDGKPSKSFEQLMLVYLDAGNLRADYVDGTHVIHYVSAAVVPGRSIAFSSGGEPGAIVYRLTYARASAKTLDVRFEISPLGDGVFRPIAVGTLTKS